jgi:hypothetical protein
VKHDDACRALMLGDFVGIYKQSSGAPAEDGERVSPHPRLPHSRVGRHAVRMADWRRVPLTTALTHKAIDVPAAGVCVPALKDKLQPIVAIVARAGTLIRCGPPMV